MNDKQQQTFTITEGGKQRSYACDPSTTRLWNILPVAAGHQSSGGTSHQGSVRVNGKTYTGEDLNKSFSDLGIQPGSTVEVLST